MATKKTMDKYANLAAMTLNESSANTNTFEKFDFPFSIMDKVGLLISRVEYWFTSLVYLDSSTDYVVGALTVSKNTSSLTDIEDPTIIDSMRVLRQDLGTAASGFFFTQPFTRDFSTLPGGGLLVAPNPLYLAVGSYNAGGVVGVSFRMYYTAVELSPEEYWQLVESRRIITD